jgi:hypothetical protein
MEPLMFFSSVLYFCRDNADGIGEGIGRQFCLWKKPDSFWCAPMSENISKISINCVSCQEFCNYRSSPVLVISSAVEIEASSDSVVRVTPKAVTA